MVARGEGVEGDFQRIAGTVLVAFSAALETRIQENRVALPQSEINVAIQRHGVTRAVLFPENGIGV